MHIVCLPIEPLVERYSAQWLEWTHKYAQNIAATTKWTFDILVPEATYVGISDGQFLDVIKTNQFKAAQLQLAIDWIAGAPEELLRSGNVVFWVHDGWFPGIEMLAYIRDAMGYNYKIAACLHAGTWDQFDFLSQKKMTPWAENLERSWMTIYDCIFVATKFHKDLILQRNRTTEAGKIFITGFPIYRYCIECKPSIKEDLVIFPHRLAPEKRPQLFDQLAEAAANTPELKHLTFVKTKDVCLGNQEEAKRNYYKMLSRAKYSVSFALQETWGIAMQESVIAGCVPLVPDQLSYSEMYPNCFKYEDESYGSAVENCLALLIKLEKQERTAHLRMLRLALRFLEVGGDAFDNMLVAMSVGVNTPGVSPYPRSWYKQDITEETA